MDRNALPPSPVHAKNRLRKRVPTMPGPATVRDHP